MLFTALQQNTTRMIWNLAKFNENQWNIIQNQRILIEI